MRALFKPEDGNVLLIRDADFNESTLLHNFFNQVKNGATIEVQERNTGVNDLVTGLVFTLSEKEEPVETPTYISVIATVSNDAESLPLFSIDFAPENSNYLCFKLDISKWAILKLSLEELGLTDVSITNEGKIVANNGGSSEITGILTIPKGLFQYVNKLDSTVSNYSDVLELTLGVEE